MHTKPTPRPHPTFLYPFLFTQTQNKATRKPKTLTFISLSFIPLPHLPVFSLFLCIKIESFDAKHTYFLNSGESISTLSREENNMVMSEESSSYPDECELELGLGLSLGGGGKSAAAAVVEGGGCRDHYARFLTAKDFPSLLSDKDSSSSSSSSYVTRANNNGGSCGVKRTADEPSSPPGRSSVSQVVGWPPVKTYRMNSLVINGKLPATQDFLSTDDKSKSKNRIKNDGKKKSSYVKVNMDGIPIGRKVDLSAHSCYETLAHALDDMFRPSAAIGMRGTNIVEHVIVAGTRQPIRLLDGLSEFVLTYEDKEGDLMLVGDVPWEMFLSSVRRLRIMRTDEANGISQKGI